MRSRIVSAICVACGLWVAAVEAGALANSPAQTWRGTVAETLSGGSYTYLLMQTGTDRVWVACYQIQAKSGDEVVVDEGRMMKDFVSPSLNRTFDRIVFASRITVGGKSPGAASRLPAGHPPVGEGAGAAPGGAPHGGQAGAGDAAAKQMRGEVIETMDAGGYTYVQVRTESETLWAAASKFAVAKGDRVTMPAGTVMKNFTSPTLNRTFETIHFVDGIRVENGSSPALPPGHP